MIKLVKSIRRAMEEPQLLALPTPQEILGNMQRENTRAERYEVLQAEKPHLRNSNTFKTNWEISLF